MTSFARSVFGAGIDSLVESKFTFNPSGIPEEMKRYKQWVTWSHVINEDGTKAKLPVYVNSSGVINRASWKNPDRQMSYDVALENYYASDLIHGLGFVFSKDDPFVFIDFDKLSVDDERHQWIDRDTFCEWSQSGNGLHMVVKGDLERAHKPTSGKIEIYPHNRFAAMTGILAGRKQAIVSSDQLVIDALIEAYPYENSRAVRSSRTNSSFELPEVVEEGSRNDTMWKFCCSLFGKGHSIEDATTIAYEANERRFSPPLESSVIDDQLERAREFVDSTTQQVDSSLADRYIFVQSDGKYFDTETKITMRKEALNTTHRSIFVGGQGNLPLFANWLEMSPNFRVAQNYVWFPCKYGEDRQIVYINSSLSVNTWQGFAVTPQEGPVDVWLKHLEHVVPEEKYRKNVIQRLAFDIQYPDKKCNWQLVFFGRHGSGKDALITPFSRIFGEASGTIGNKDVKGSFDDGFVKKKIVTVSEVNGLQGDALEELKRKSATENSSLIMLNPKKESKIAQYNLWSIIFITNHSDAMKMNKRERRFFVLRSDNEMKEDDADTYFEWVNNNGPSYLMHYLLNYDLTDFNPHVLTERTSHFYDMIDSTDNDMESILRDWNDLKIKSFSNNIVHPDWIKQDLLEENVKCSISRIKKWLTENKWITFNSRIQKWFVEGTKYKSRQHYAHKDDPMHKKTSLNIYESIENIENMRNETKFS